MVDDMELLLTRDEAGCSVAESDSDSRGWVTIEAARRAVAAYDEWAAQTPRAYAQRQARLAISPILDQAAGTRLVGWYVDFTDKD